MVCVVAVWCDFLFRLDPLHVADVRIREFIVELLMKYNLAWIQVAMETITGLVIGVCVCVCDVIVRVCVLYVCVRVHAGSSSK